MRPWTRLQDWITLLAGAYTIISPIVLSTIGMAGEAKVVVAMITLGALVAISSLVSLARPAVSAGVWATTGFGVLLFVAPWVVGYAGLTGPAWTSWLVGVLVVVVSQTVLRPFNWGPRRAIQQ
jgi:SPW repeat